MWYSIVLYLILKHRVAPDCWLSSYVITSDVMQFWLWHDCSSVLTPTFNYFFRNYTVWNLRFFANFKTRSHQCSIFDCRWLSHMSDINKGLIGAYAILYSWTLHCNWKRWKNSTLGWNVAIIPPSRDQRWRRRWKAFIFHLNVVEHHNMVESENACSHRMWCKS